MKVPLLDLTAQYETIRPAVEEAVRRVFESQYFILGPEVDAFEQEVGAVIGTTHAVSCASGTDALLLPLRAFELAPGDEVVVPAFTFFASAGAVANAGLVPVFCDVDADSFNLTRATVEAAWRPRTRSVMAVHLFGQMAPMDELSDLAASKGSLLLEDAAQSIGAQQTDRTGRTRAAGTVGAVGAFSFFPTKNLGGAGDGGLMTTEDDELARRLRDLRVHGGRQMYHHERVGTNSRLDALQAAVLRAKLGHLRAWTDGRRANAARYTERLTAVDEVLLPREVDGNYHVYNQYTIRAESRDALREHLGALGIGSGVYYPLPLHLQECFSGLGYREGELPVSEGLCREVLSLPVYPEVGEERIDRVCGAIRAFYG
jgi:dTDP-4-amino-4,6-dideoxygalactose transaminase